MKKKIFLIITILMIAVIWTHSMMPGVASSAESGFVAKFIANIIKVDYKQIEGTIRKMAHFFEFMVLGILVTTDTILWFKKSITSFGAFVGLIVPTVDETIQLFVPNRNGSLFDVWLDFIGFVIGMVFLTVLYRLKQTNNE